MSRKIELLAPGGDAEAIKAAIVAGADAVYCGLDSFNARNRAANLSFDELCGVIRLGHEYECQIFLTLNIIILEQEINSLVKLLNRLVNIGLDGVIVQDLGLFFLVKKYFPTLDIHASTQLTTHNEGQIKFLGKIGASRANLSRELNLAEIKSLTAVAHQENVLIEVFVHGSLCIGFSGQCYATSVTEGNSGNRGRCSQACRDEYEVTAVGNKFPLNLKDNSAYFELAELVDAKVDSLKIEGRIKGSHYVYTVVDSWRKHLDQFIATGELSGDDSNLHKVFNRGFTNSFLTGNLNKSMFIDNPRDNSVNYAINKTNSVSSFQIKSVRETLYQDKNKIGDTLRTKIKDLSIEKPEVSFQISGQIDKPLTVSVTTETKHFVVQSSSTMKLAQKQSVDQVMLTKRLNSFNNEGFTVKAIEFDAYGVDLAIPFKELNELKNQISLELNNGRAFVKNVEVPAPTNHSKVTVKPSLSVMISDPKDLYLCDETDADIYFKLPESFKRDCSNFIELFNDNPRLIPWFPAVLIGKDYDQAINILEQVKPQRIISNNTGIAYKAAELGIDWIAGPFLNTTNSFALLTLQETLHCKGAFISNEISRMQMKAIKRPENFKLYYSIYHPILMMTSRQCFFQQTVGCKKLKIDAGCMIKCEKATTITNLKGVSFSVNKQKGGYPSLYNHEPFMNLDVVSELSTLYDEFFIDLSDIGLSSESQLDKASLVKNFERFIAGGEEAGQQLKAMVPMSTDAQYLRGL